jgi:hypothetical protein
MLHLLMAEEVGISGRLMMSFMEKQEEHGP